MPAENIFFITNQENFFNVFNQIKDVCPNFNKENILIEPASLNTAPAITYAIKHLAEKVKINLGEPIIFLPSDHYIGDEKKYLNTIKLALKETGDNIGTIGIIPKRPDTGYGYIKKGEKIGNYFKALGFKEKPNQIIAEEYFNSGEYVWNSGMYIFNIRAFVRELRAHAPQIYGLLAENFAVFKEKFHELPSISIDYAISEKSDRVIVFEGDFIWSDIGSFDSLSELTAEIMEKKEQNILATRHIGIDSKNIFVHSVNNRLVATIGVEDLIVIENNDSILIQKKGQSEGVKKIVEKLKKNQSKELEDNLVVYRPWGKYEVLIDTATHKVKKITVYPGAKLSLQSHYHRVEHWVVIKGVAKIVNNDKDIFLRENESTFIPTLTTHRLENPGKINLEIIEIQTGNYMEEDDIIRYDDVYGRI
jgi:mannose-1-phosphate guanylyltransferase/mannose-6-phosphate isomerase